MRRQSCSGVLLAAIGLAVSGCAELGSAGSWLEATFASAETKSHPGVPRPSPAHSLTAVQMRVAEIAFRHGDYDAAARLYQRAHKTAPDQVEPLLGLAQAQIRQGNRAGAEATLRQALVTAPDHPEVRRQLSVALILENRIDEGVAYARPFDAAPEPAAPAEASSASETIDAQAETHDGTTGNVFARIASLFDTLFHSSSARVDSEQDDRQPAQASVAAPKPAAASAGWSSVTALQATAASAVNPQAGGATATSVVAALPAGDAGLDTGSSRAALRGYRAQLAAYRSRREAERGRDVFAQRLGTDPSTLVLFVKQRPGTETREAPYRVSSAVLSSKSEASAFCAKAHRAGITCMVIRHNEAYWQPS